jgi:hypothetical protein
MVTSLEEFSGLATQKGVIFARRWYWRQTIKTIGAILSDSFRAAQWLIAVVTIWFLSGYVQWVYRKMAVVFLAHYHVYAHVNPHGFWLFYDIVIGCLIIPMASFAMASTFSTCWGSHPGSAANVPSAHHARNNSTTRSSGRCLRNRPSRTLRALAATDLS